MSLELRAGLRLRLQRAGQRMRGQHRRLRSLLRDAESAARAGRELCDCVTSLRDGLRAHFDLEEEVCFTALHGLEPTSGTQLARLVDEHRAFLEELGRLEAVPADAAERVLRLGAALRDHESREEQLMGHLLSGDAARA